LTEVGHDTRSSARGPARSVLAAPRSPRQRVLWRVSLHSGRRSGGAGLCGGVAQPEARRAARARGGVDYCTRPAPAGRRGPPGPAAARAAVVGWRGRVTASAGRKRALAGARWRGRLGRRAARAPEGSGRAGAAAAQARRRTSRPRGHKQWACRQYYSVRGLGGFCLSRAWGLLSRLPGSAARGGLRRRQGLRVQQRPCSRGRAAPGAAARGPGARPVARSPRRRRRDEPRRPVACETCGTRSAAPVSERLTWRRRRSAGPTPLKRRGTP
jgi:hypothetical protein